MASGFRFFKTKTLGVGWISAGIRLWCDYPMKLLKAGSLPGDFTKHPRRSRGEDRRRGHATGPSLAGRDAGSATLAAAPHLRLALCARGAEPERANNKGN